MSVNAQTTVSIPEHGPVVVMTDDELREVRTVFRDGTPEQVASLLDAVPALPFQLIVTDQGSPEDVLEIAAATRERDKMEAILSRNRAAARGHESVLTALLENRRRGDEAADPALVELLVAHGAVFPTERLACRHFVQRGLERCFQEDDLPLLDRLVRLGFDPVEAERTLGTSLVHRALYNRAYENTALVAERLIDLGCELRGPGGSNDGGHIEHSLRLALSHGLYDTARRIMDRLEDTTVPDGEALCLAAEHPELPIDLRERLLDGVSGFDTPCLGSPPLHRAATHANTAVIDYLLAHGASLESVDERGHTALFAAVVGRSKSAVLRQLIAAGSDVNHVDLDGRTMLDHARSRSSSEHVRARLEKAGAKRSVELVATGDGAVAAVDLVRGDVDEGEPWADELLGRLLASDGEQVRHWHALILHCLGNKSSRPSARWLKQAAPLLEAIGDDAFRETMLVVLPKLTELRRDTRTEEEQDDENGWYDDWFNPSAFGERNVRLLKGFLWLCGRYTDTDVCATLRQTAVIGYKKVYGIGMRNAKIANAAALALAGMPGDSGVKELSILRATTRYNPAKVSIDRVFDKIAAERGLSPDELAEVSTPHYGLSGVGSWEGVFGDFTARLTLAGVGKSVLTWHKGEKTQKSVPAVVKAEHAEALKALKSRVKEIDTATRAHARRIEQGYLSGRRHTRDEWLERLIDHPLVGHLGRRLVWQVKDGRKRFGVMHDGTNLVGTDGKVASVTDKAVVSLWHPSLASVDEVVHWRRWIVERGITQPFKQAHREVYLLTDAERATADHSMRFANHILHHSQFHALATQRGWHQLRGGPWCGGQENSATRELPAHGLVAEFDAEGVERYGSTGSGIYQCVGTGSVRFYRHHARVELQKLDPLVFSEVMRDVDLFVGVSGVANDPEWQARDVDDYWSSNAFGKLGEQAKTRHAVLETLIPQLRIGERLRLEERFLIVEGTRRTYRIHLGSSNILMEPNDQYLCIVTTRTASTIMLPFEGDRTLSLILSKALMLADDAKIKDPTILSQIGGGA